MKLTRRHFIQSVAGATVLSAAGLPAQAEQAQAHPSVCIFSKHLESLDYPELAAAFREIGVDGVDLTVRRGGHVLPENVARDLPAATEAMRAEGLEVSMITTALRSGGDADAEPILEAAGALGIPYFRIGGHKYEEGADPAAQLPQVAGELRQLALLAEKHGVTAGYHNHSGRLNVGAPLWDLHQLYTGIASPNLGSNFDVGHARIEGAHGVWEINAQLLAPHTKMMAVKDFVWDGDRPRWVPLGEGIVPLVPMLRIFQAAGFLGPISVHVEYRVDSDEAMIEELRAATATLREAMSEAGYP